MANVNSPAFSQAFCKEHTKIISSLGYPTELREFLKSCAADGEEIDPDNYTKSMQQKVDAVLIKICNKIPASSKFKSCIDTNFNFKNLPPDNSLLQELVIC